MVVRSGSEGTDAIRLDQVQIAELRELMAEDFDLLLETFLSDGEVRVAELASLVGNPEALRRAAHSLKGGASNIGAVALTALCLHLESLGAADAADAAHALVRAIRTEFDAVRDALTQLRH
ncbi:MAG: Hpt domain-containing protein [Gammaproteobacteria bacterium]|nr:Hpt domain-containing protein [Gammaproteobacteria bacterium]